MNTAISEQLTDSSHSQFAQSLSAYGDAIDEGLRQLSSRAGVSASDIDSCKTLRSQLLDLIDAKLTHPQQSHTQDQSAGWGWQSWMDRPALRIGVLTVYENKPVPIHDHPGSAGLLIVLQGRLQVKLYKASQMNNTYARSIELHLDRELEAGPGEFAIFSPLEGNIHSVHAGEGPCIVLDILFNPYKEQERGWYMPIGESREDQTRLHTIRINRPQSL